MNVPKVWVAAVAMALAAPAFAQLAGQPAAPQRPRIVISRRQVNRLRVAASSGDVRYVTLRQWSESNLHDKAGSYLPAQDSHGGWLAAAQSYALLYRIDPDENLRKAFAAESLVYVKALADDLAAVGDGKGGAALAAGEHSLADRVMALATAFDWLYDYEGLDAALKTHVTARLDEWSAKVDSAARAGGQAEPWEGRYVSALAARTFAAAATLDADPQARGRLIAAAAADLKQRVLPAYASRCAGGYCPEGWSEACRYGAAVDAILTIRNVAGDQFDTSFFPHVVRAVIHSTKPDRRRVYDGGVWPGDYAGYPLPLALMARLSALLDGSPAAELARFYVIEFAEHDRFNSLSPVDGLLYLDLLGVRTDFTKTEPLSFFAPGTGLVVCRSSWREGAFWTSFQSGAPKVEGQADYGHVTADILGAALLMDAGAWDERLADGKAIRNRAYGAEWHNTPFVGPPSAPASPASAAGTLKTLGFEDPGPYAYTRANLTGACDFAKSVERGVFYLRPATLVVMDRIEPVEPGQQRGIAFHFPRASEPRLEKDSLTAAIGPAMLGLWSVLPAMPALELAKQYAVADGDREADAYSWALKVSGPAGEPSTRFYTVLSAGQPDAQGKFAGVKPLVRGQRGVILESGGRLAVVFFVEPTDPAIGFAVPPVGGMDMYILGLEPSRRYGIKLTPQGKVLQVVISPSDAGDMASPNGVLQVHLQPRPGPQQ